MSANPPAPPPEGQSIPPDVSPRGLQPTHIDPLKARESQTARHITITLLVMLITTFLTNIVVMIVLTIYSRLDAIAPFERMFSIWMPVLSGLVGSAVGFYLTKDKK